jgi:hypothetical protein
MSCPNSLYRKYGILEAVKTTLEIPDQLADEARQYAANHGLSLREVHERALRLLLYASADLGTPFRLNTVVTQGEGLQVPNDWATIRDLIYPVSGE